MPGYSVLLSPQEDPPRPPDDEIDFDAQFQSQIPVEPKGLNIYTSDRDRYVAVDLGFYVYPPLAERKNGAKDEWKPALAEQVEVSPDRTEFYIYLRPGVYWHRPPLDLTNPKYAWMKGRHEVTSADVVFTLQMILDERADTDSIRSEFEDIVEYEAVDKYTVRVKWKEPNFYATGALLGDIQTIPRWIFAYEEDGSPIDEASLGQRFARHWFSKMMCGCGPYRFKEYKQSDYILLERNEDYWGRRPAFKTIFYKLALQDDEPRYNTFMTRNEEGRRDQHIYPVSPIRWDREVLNPDADTPLTDMEQVYIFQYQRMMYAYTGWACRGKFFDDPRVRRAMTHAANRASWMHDILNDIAIVPTGPAFTESPEHDPSVEMWPYDLDEASRLLAEAGWEDRDDNGVREKEIEGETIEFRFRMVQTPGSPAIDAMFSDWQNSLRKIGVIVTPLTVEWNEFLKRIRDREFDAYAGAWFHGDDFNPESIFHSKQIEIPGSQNYVEFGDPRADEIIEALKTEFDLEKRYELAHELHAIFHELQPYTNMWSWRNPIAHDSHIGGMTTRNFSPQYDLRYLYWMKEGLAKYTDGRDRRPTR
jgi:ABC-type transport system substrate-binding protein